MKALAPITGLIIGLFAITASAQAADPADFVRSHMKSFQATASASSLGKLKTDIRKVFDFATFSEDTMGKRWAQLSASQKKKFSDTMQRLLESSYLKHPEKIFGKHDVKIEDSETSGNKAEVAGTVQQDDVDIEVVLKMKKAGKAWMVTDIVFDELSMMEDYKYQFISFLKKKSVDDLIKKLNERAAENELAARKKMSN